MNISGIDMGREDFGWGPGVHSQQMVSPELDVFRPDAVDCSPSSSVLSRAEDAGIVSVWEDNTLLPPTSVVAGSNPTSVRYVGTEGFFIENGHAGGYIGTDGVGPGNGRGRMGGVFANDKGSAGDAGAVCEPGAKRRRGPCRHSWGEDDLEFLRTLVSETDSTINGHNEPPTPPTSDLASSSPESQHPCLSTVLVETVLTPIQGTGSPPRAPRPATINRGRVVEKSLCDTQGDFSAGITEEEKLEAADYVATLLWRASPRLRDHLLARVNDSWARAEQDLAAARDAAARGPTFAQAGEPLMSDRVAALVPRAHHSLKGILMERLEETRKAVELQVPSEGEAAPYRGWIPSLPKAPRWLGVRALRADVCEKLKQFQSNARDQKQADIMAKAKDAKARGATNEELVQLLEHIRLELSTQAVDSGIEPLTYDTKLAEIDRFTEALVQQLNENYKAMIANMNPTEICAARLKEGLLERLNATRVAAEAELRAADEAAQAAASRPNPSTVGDVVGMPAAAPIPPAGMASRGSGDTEDEDVNLGMRVAAVKTVHPRTEEAVGGGDAGVRAGKRRKKSSSGGRRCAHDGCSLHPHFGVDRPEYCSSHKLPGMFNVKGRQCTHPECTRTPVYGKAGDRHPTFCAAHKMVDMVDIKNPTCREPTCARQPSFGSPNDRRATYCAKHMLSGMVNVRRQLAARAKSNGGAAFARSNPEAMMSEVPDVIDVGPHLT